MTPDTFERFRSLIYATSGITLGPAKATLVRARIGKRMRSLNIDDPDAYFDHIEHDGTGQELVALLDAISTNVTSFFREPDHFEHLARFLGERVAAGQRRFRLWSAASSTGEEPYTIAMICREVLPADADVRILATDISPTVLERCRSGRYPADRMNGVNQERLRKFFHMRSEEGSTVYEATSDLRRMLHIKRLNLSQPPFPMQGPMDAVFCRNVMIYFDNQVRSRLLADIQRLLGPGCPLFVGHAESLTGMTCDLRSVAPAMYVKD